MVCDEWVIKMSIYYYLFVEREEAKKVLVFDIGTSISESERDIDKLIEQLDDIMENDLSERPVVEMTVSDLSKILNVYDIIEQIKYGGWSTYGSLYKNLKIWTLTTLGDDYRIVSDSKVSEMENEYKREGYKLLYCNIDWDVIEWMRKRESH